MQAFCCLSRLSGMWTRALALACTLSLGLAGTALAQEYNEAENLAAAWGQTVKDFSDPTESAEVVALSAENVLQRMGESPESKGPYALGHWPWTGDPDRTPAKWEAAGKGEVHDLRFPNRNGVSLHATIWVPSGFKGARPGIVYSPGVLSDEAMYFWFAQGMAEAGYVVMTYEIPGQGRSDQGTSDPPAELRDALTFFLSAANPARAKVDATRIGTAGHSLGAGAVQSVGDFGGVVKAISAHSDLRGTYAGSAPIQGQGADYDNFIFPPMPSQDGAGGRSDGKLGAFAAIRERGVSVQEVVIESATHLAWSHVPWSYTAVWSEEVALHYSLAWFDRWLMGNRRRGGKTAEQRLTENYAAQELGPQQQLEPSKRSHGVSRKYNSAYDVVSADASTRWQCEDMVGRDGCTQPRAAKKPKR